MRVEQPGPDSFLELSDTPNSYLGSANKDVNVKSTEDGLEFSSDVITIGDVITGGTPGSVLFVDNSGNLGQDNTNFNWNDTTNILSVNQIYPTIYGNQSAIDHGSIGGLSDDDHTQYALLAGRADGQFLKGGTNSGDILSLMGSSNEDGSINFGLNSGVEDSSGLLWASTLLSPTLKGSVISAGNLNLQSTFHPTKGRLLTDPITITSPTATAVGQIIKGAVSQSGNLLEFRDSAETLLTDIGPTGHFGIGTPSAANTAMKLSLTGRLGIDIKHTSLTDPYPTALNVNFTTQAATQGTGFDFSVVSSGTTEPDDNLVGMNFLVSQRRTSTAGGGGTGVMSQMYIDTNTSLNQTSSSLEAGRFFAGLGYSNAGTGTHTVTTAAGVKAALQKNGGAGQVTFTNWASFYAPADTGIWEGTGTFTITNGRGVWAEEQTRATNNTNFLIGTGTTGNWSIYNNSTYDSLLLATTKKGYIRDTGIYINSNDDGHLDLTADVSIDLNGLTVSQNIIPATDDTYYLGEIGTPFKAYKGIILKDTTDGKHYKITSVSGVLTTTALD